MKAEQKAQELISKYEPFIEIAFSEHGKLLRKEKIKKCAIICVDEIINLCAFGLSETEYWQQVKSHLQQL